MNWIKKLFGIKSKGKFEVVYTERGIWDIKVTSSVTVTEFCVFEILYNETTEKYKLECSGHNPKNHPMYYEVFRMYRMLCDGLAYHKGGKLYHTESNSNSETFNGKSIESLNETECRVYLDKAISEENYELAEKLQKRLDELN
jgi:hypothetical protein